MSDTTILNGGPQQTTVKFVQNATVIKNVTAETVLKFVPNQTAIKNVTAETVVKMSMPGMSLAMFAALFEAYVANLDEYDSDEAAALGGVASGEWYRTSSDHVACIGGILKQNKL